jgi:hypothetical protein
VKFNSPYNYNIRGVYSITGTTTINGGTVNFISPITNLGSLVVGGQFTNLDLGSNSVSLNSLNLRLGTITGSGTITVNDLLEWNEGSITGTGIINAQGGVFFNGLTGSVQFDILDRTLNCYGSSSVQTTMSYMGTLHFGLNAALNIMTGATFNGSRLMIAGSNTFGQTNGIVTNYGTLVVDNPEVNRGMAVFGTAFVNQGNISITNSVLDVRNTTDQPAFVQTAGSLQLNNGTLACDKTTLNGGSLTGSGTVGNIVSNALIAPTGTLDCQSLLTLQSESVIAFTLNGTQPGVSFGRITNISTATLGGTLQVTLTGSFQSQITSSDIFTVLSAQSIVGQFTNVVSGGRLFTTDGSGSFTVTYSGNYVILTNFIRSMGRIDTPLLIP